MIDIEREQIARTSDEAPASPLLPLLVQLVYRMLLDDRIERHRPARTRDGQAA